MAYIVRAKGGVVVGAGEAATYAGVQEDEVAVVVPGSPIGNTTFETLKRSSHASRPPRQINAGEVLVVTDVASNALAAATPVPAGQVAIVLGRSAALKLDQSLFVATLVLKCIERLI